MDTLKLLDTYKNGRRVRERLYTHELKTRTPREGEIYGTSLGGATKRGGNRPMLNVTVKWDDKTESTTHHTALEVIDA